MKLADEIKRYKKMPEWEIKEELMKIFTAKPDLISWIAQWAESKRFVCPCCGKTKVSSGFYRIRPNEVYKTGQLPICRKCLNKLFDYYCGKYGDNAWKAMERICQICNMPYIESMLDSCQASNSIVGQYIQKMNLRQNRRKKSYDDTKVNESNFVRVIYR